MQKFLDVEQEMISRKSCFEQKIINKNRSAFSNYMSRDRFLTREEMLIKLRQLKYCSNLYCYCPVPANIQKEAKELIDNLEQNGII